MKSPLAGKSMLVVGGSSGIGLAAALAAADAGVDVSIVSRNPEKLVGANTVSGGRLRASVLDATDNVAVEAFFASSGPFDHVVISAASTKGGPIRELPLADAYASMESKFWGAYRVARVASIKPGGSLTLVSGFLSQRPSPRAVLQGAINAALEGLMRGLALEFAPVRVNAVSPGLIDTPLYAGLQEAQRAALFDSTRKRLPVQRVGLADDVAQAILFLAVNRYATGTVVTVDGGGTIV